MQEHWHESYPDRQSICLLRGLFHDFGRLNRNGVRVAKITTLHTFADSDLRIVLLAGSIGLVLSLLIQSPWGKRSGAHMNPAITLAFLRLKKIHPWDALFYVVAQAIGGTLGIALVARFAGRLFTDPPVSYAITVPGSKGEAVAFVAEMLISFHAHGDHPGFHCLASPDSLHGRCDRRSGSFLDHR